jgi:Right handed beta helix region
MRGEVMLMSRNIRIVGNDTDKWGCQVVTSDFVEADGVIRIGRTFMDHVEVYNCS